MQNMQQKIVVSLLWLFWFCFVWGFFGWLVWFFFFPRQDFGPVGIFPKVFCKLLASDLVVLASFFCSQREAALLEYKFHRLKMDEDEMNYDCESDHPDYFFLS